MAIDQLDRTADRVFQRLIDVHEAGHARIAAWLECDQEVGVAAWRVEIRATGSGAEDFQPPDVEPAAQICKRVSFAADGGA